MTSTAQLGEALTDSRQRIGLPGRYDLGILLVHGLGEQARVQAGDVRAVLGREHGPWDLAFLDPPYEARDIVAPLEALIPRLAPGATVVIKHFWRSAPPEVGSLRQVRQRRFGETTLTFYRRAEDR
jgi:16S rRNA G966 N2-methylase RsmD